jgi:5-methylcytosine-specific restriction endonuclease McrA
MTKRRIPVKLQRLVTERAFGCCEYCICPDSHATHAHSNEHIIPEALGGTTDADNLALACQGCNNKKYNKTHAVDPISEEIVPLFHPRRDNWHEHFAWSPDCLTLKGLTATGRATIAALDLNRQRVINLRRILIRDGLHPPAHRVTAK